MKGKSHAILVYDGKRPVGWCQYGPKEEPPRIDAGRGYRKVEPLKSGKKLWRITCFFVDRECRGKGIAETALTGAIDSIREQGGGIVEAYLSYPKRWKQSQNGSGSEPRECFGEPASNLSLLLAQVFNL